jgi:hypothetical protein
MYIYINFVVCCQFNSTINMNTCMYHKDIVIHLLLEPIYHTLKKSGCVGTALDEANPRGYVVLRGHAGGCGHQGEQC